MIISKQQNQTALTLQLEGRLDAASAPQLEEELNSSLEGITDLTLDFAKLDYVSSAGFRVLIIAYRAMHDRGSLQIVNANGVVRDAFKVTGVGDIIRIR